MQFAFVTFENESDCADASKAHTHIGGAKVNVSYAFAKAEKPTTTDLNKNQEKKSTTPTENTTKKQQPKPVEKQTVTNTIYVGQLPENVEESDIKKLFSKSTKIELIPAKTNPKGVRPGFAFVTFSDDNSAAAAIKLGPSLKLKNTPLKVAYQTKRATATD
jgi:RNA recognition motif-containing protein